MHNCAHTPITLKTSGIFENDDVSCDLDALGLSVKISDDFEGKLGLATNDHKA